MTRWVANVFCRLLLMLDNNVCLYNRAARIIAIVMLFSPRTRLHPLHPRAQRADLTPPVFSPRLGLICSTDVPPASERDDDTTTIILRA